VITNTARRPSSRIDAAIATTLEGQRWWAQPQRQQQRIKPWLDVAKAAAVVEAAAADDRWTIRAIDMRKSFIVVSFR
jgi:hypothetical protein